MVSPDMPTVLSDRFLIGLDLYEARIKLQSGHGGVTVTHVRARDLEQAAAIAKRYCDLHGARFIGVYQFVVADASILDEAGGSTATSLERSASSESVAERLGRHAVPANDDDEAAAAAPPAGRSRGANGRVGA
jgi:hypothetical protein